MIKYRERIKEVFEQCGVDDPVQVLIAMLQLFEKHHEAMTISGMDKVFTDHLENIHGKSSSVGDSVRNAARCQVNIKTASAKERAAKNPELPDTDPDAKRFEAVAAILDYCIPQWTAQTSLMMQSARLAQRARREQAEGSTDQPPAGED